MNSRLHTILLQVATGLMVVMFTFVSIFGFWPAKKSEALFGVGDVTFTTESVSIPKIIGDILIQLAETAFAATKKAALQWITKRITNAILGVDDKNSGFIEVWSDHLFRAGDEALGSILNDLFGANLCKLPNYINAKTLQSNIKLTLALPGGGARGGPNGGDYIKNSPACQLSAIIRNVNGIWDSALAMGDQIAHDGWKNFNMLLEPTGNEFGIYLTTTVELFGVKQKLTSENATKAVAYKGYTGKSDPKTGKTLVPGSTGEAAVNSALTSPIKSIIDSKDIKELGAAVFTASLVRLINEGLKAADVKVRVNPSQVGGVVRPGIGAVVGDGGSGGNVTPSPGGATPDGG